MYNMRTGLSNPERLNLRHKYTISLLYISHGLCNIDDQFFGFTCVGAR